MRFLCLRQVPLLRGSYKVQRIDAALVHTYLDNVARDVNIMPRSIMLKGSRRRRVSELSCAFFSLFNFASFDNCGGIPGAPVANSFPCTNGTASLTSSP